VLTGAVICRRALVSILGSSAEEVVIMGSGERSGPGGQDDWRVRITTGVGAAACLAGAILLDPVVGINGFWPGMLAGAVAFGLGGILGRLVGGLLFRPSSGGPAEDKKGTSRGRG
jgi:hypothetical protein